MSTMKNPLCSFLSRLALCGLAAPLILLSPALVRADAITTFVVSGTANNNSEISSLGSCAAGATCAFSGMFQVNTTTGTLVSSSFNITFPGLSAFDEVLRSRAASNLWEISALNTSGRLGILDLFFTTAPTAGSLKGFTGGSISKMSVVNIGVFGGPDLFTINGGSITPVPEPSSLLLFATGMLVLGLTRRFGKKVGHPLSA